MAAYYVECRCNCWVSRLCIYLDICSNISEIRRPLVGGSLSHPYERIPHLFGDNKLWKRHPYLLPCLFSATVSASSFVLALLFLKEVSHVYLVFTPILTSISCRHYILGESPRSMMAMGNTSSSSRGLVPQFPTLSPPQPSLSSAVLVPLFVPSSHRRF